MSQSTAVATREAPKSTGVSALLEHARHRIEPFLPAGVSLERTMTAVYLATKDNPTILDCAPESIVRAVGRILQWGLEPGVTAHLVPFGKTCTPVADYKGLVELMIASGAVRSVEARCVYSGEVFECEQGLAPVLRHVPAPGAKDRGTLVGAYCILRLPRNQSAFEYMPIEDIDAIREKYSKQWKKGACPPWYAMKTVVRQSTKLVPKNPRLAALLAVIREDEAGEFEEISANQPLIETPGAASREEVGAPELTYRTLGPVSPAGYEADNETPDAGRFAAGYEPPTRAGATVPQLSPAAIAEAASADPYELGIPADARDEFDDEDRR